MPFSGKRRRAASTCSRSTNSSGSTRSNHHRTSIAASRIDPRNRKRAGRVSGILCLQAEYALNPDPENDHGVQHDERFPEEAMSEIEQRQAVLPEVEKTDEAQKIDALNGDTSD